MKIFHCVIFLILCQPAMAQKKSYPARVDSLLALMTPEEKVGQLHQISSPFAATGPITPTGNFQQQIREGKIGSMLNVTGASRTRQLQEIALQSRLKIPLLFGQDVIHGYRTTFPVPLGEAASWNLQTIEQAARIAAIEASASGIHWTFAPMVDIGRDPRWGRVMEGAGEDPWLGSKIAEARVRGFQGKGLGSIASLMACAKHFAAYGAALGGRDYNSVDMSERQLRELYLPPFKAAVDAGVATLMNSFNDLNGIPATGSALLQRKILKGEWDFKGFVVSDWGSIREMQPHGFAASLEDAARIAILAGSDMDMESRAYTQHLASLVQQGKVPISLLDDAVRRVLIKKYETGIMDDPFRYCDIATEKQQFNNEVNLDAAQSIASESIVLLKNNSSVSGGSALLPLATSGQKIAMIGPLVMAKKEHLGFWSFDWPDDSARIKTVGDAVKQRLSKASDFFYARGCGLNDTDTSGFAEAVRVASQADIIVLYLGEERAMSGEAKSRSNLHLPGVQEVLAERMAALGKPIVLMLGAGRPLVFEKPAKKASAILYTWWLGTRAGDAIADVLFGKINPSGKLPMTFPRTEGQIPIFYNYLNTGRPFKNETDHNYVSAYIDLPNSPAYPFGFGLSYTQFKYGAIAVNTERPTETGTLQIAIPVTNTGKKAGYEVVQLYIRDKVASTVRPVKELKGFKKLWFEPGQTKEVTFQLTTKDLYFYANDLAYIWEPGEFVIMVGTDSDNVSSKKITWLK